jgi:hypothetical protein
MVSVNRSEGLKAKAKCVVDNLIYEEAGLGIWESKQILAHAHAYILSKFPIQEMLLYWQEVCMCRSRQLFHLASVSTQQFLIWAARSLFLSSLSMWVPLTHLGGFR